MKKWHVVIIAVLFLALGTTVFAFGGRGGFGYGGCGGDGPGFGGPMRMAANLNLTKEQTEKMWQIKEKFRSDTQKLRYEIFQKQVELKDLYADPKVNEATLLAKQKELNTLKQNMHDRVIQMKLEQRRILTPEQIKKSGETPCGIGFGRRGEGFGTRGHGPGFGPAKS